MTDAGLVGLERRLARLGPRLDYPPAGGLAEAVTARLELEVERRAAPSPALRLARWWERLRLRGIGGDRPAWARAAAVAVGALLVFGAVLVASPAARDAVAGWLGLRGVRITGPDTALPSPAFGSLRLGERVTLEESRDRVAFTVLVPEGLTPDEVYVGRGVPGGEVSLVFRAGPGLPEAHETGAALLLTQFRGQVDQARLGKSVDFEGNGTSVTAVVVSGGRGLWIEGGPHLVYYLDDSGEVREETVRLAGNVLLWEQGDLTLRLESALPLMEALRIAETVG